MNPELSIIIPCYNCEKTLEEAVNSCFTQGLTEPFEIVTVDDGSTDRTRDVIKKLAETHKEIRLFYHNQNKGGGATRNTAVKNSNADIIFCLDSDDILPPYTLGKMIACLSDKGCDGVAFSGAYSFSKDKNTSKKIDFRLSDSEPITLDYLFSKKAWPGGNFLYTRKAFEASGGYPIDHPFDTQGYGFRFLVNGMKAYPCPNTFLYQRQFGKDVSYFERAYNAGEFSIGHYLMFLEYLNIFSTKIQSMILNYDIFAKYTLEENILSDLQKEYENDTTSFFSGKDNNDSVDNPELEYQKGNFKKTLDLFLSSERKYKNIYFDGVRYIYGRINNQRMTIAEYKLFTENNSVKTNKHHSLRPALIQRIRRKIRRIKSDILKRP